MPKKRKYNKSTGRKYEYDRAYAAKPEEKKKRAKRNAARRKMEKAGKVKKGDGKDVDHKRGIGGGNGAKNLRVVSKSKNRNTVNQRVRRGGNSKKKGK